MSEIEILKDVEVGKFYKVPCVIEQRCGRRKKVIPVIPFLHADKQFGTETGALLHFHVDTRFFDADLDWRYEVSKGRTLRVFVPEDDSEKRIVYRRLKCQRKEFGLIVLKQGEIERHEPVAKWYEAQVGKKCLGNKCPHYGVEMVDVGKGLLECKLHGLLADKKTLKVVGNVHQGVIKK